MPQSDIQKQADLNAENEAAKIEIEAHEDKVKFAKSGKKSKKHIEEVKAEEARQELKEKRSQEANEKSKPKGEAPKVRPKIERRGKNYQAKSKIIDHDKSYPLKDAIELAIKTNPSKFDASLEGHFRLGVDPRQADQNIRSTLVLPNGNGKKIRVAVYAPSDTLDKAKKAGADIAKDQELLTDLEKGIIDFDVLITTPKYMPKLSKYARVLGPKGLMPNPKSGTVTENITKAVKEAKAGKVEYRVDKQGIIHLSLGKVSFGSEKLLANTNAFIASLLSNKPSALKGQFIKSIYLTTTMGPSIKVENTYN